MQIRTVLFGTSKIPASLDRLGQRRLVITAIFTLVLALMVLLQAPGVILVAAQQATDTVPAVEATITSTPIPEYMRNLNQTNGIIVGGVILVLIILGGTLNSLRRHPQH